MQSLREAIAEAKKARRAVGHFNFSDSNQLHAIALASKETRLPVIVGLSEGERDFFPLSHARALVDLYREQGLQMYLNADHTYSVDKVTRAISAGADSVVVDGAKLPYAENAELVRTCVKYARASGRDVLMEGELGYIGSGSTVLTELPEGAALTQEMMTSTEEAKRYVEETGIDLFAPAVGNVHGMRGVGQDPALDIERIRDLAQTVEVPLVLHGASGNTDEEILAAIQAGISVIHINTELRVAYKRALKDTLGNEEVAPYQFLEPVVEDMKRFIIKKMRLFATV